MYNNFNILFTYSYYINIYEITTYIIIIWIYLFYKII